jgi:RimJ/RimL family protein N-acetyltransferase
MIFETERLIIRNWRDADRPVFAGIVADPRARIHQPGVVSRAESDAFIDRQIETIDRIGCGFAVVERKSDGAVIGDGGIRPVPDNLPFSGAGSFEIGWQLDPRYFGMGFATEAARGWLAHGFGALGLGEVIAYTAAINRPSERVMRRIGMTRDPARDFEHPKLPEGHRLRAHIVYSISSPNK